ncbi:MAG: hypothetical protein MJ237_01335 [bacterium]|nr:hypothetical protein [bacterium]
MSSFSVNKIYTYSTANIYTYLGRVPANETTLKRIFDKYNITPTGDVDDLKELNEAIYQDYSKQVRNQINNQNAKKNDVPWRDLCGQIGIDATGDYEKDLAAFYEGIKLLSQSAANDGQAMTYFAHLRDEAKQVFGLSNNPGKQQPPVTFDVFKAQFLR